MTERAEIIERLRDWATSLATPGDLGTDLTKAADLLEAESREEYRVVGEDRPGLQRMRCNSLDEAKQRAADRANPASSLIRPWTNVRIQRSEVTTHRTPWVDVEAGEAGE